MIITQISCIRPDILFQDGIGAASQIAETTDLLVFHGDCPYNDISFEGHPPLQWNADPITGWFDGGSRVTAQTVEARYTSFYNHPDMKIMLDGVEHIWYMPEDHERSNDFDFTVGYCSDVDQQGADGTPYYQPRCVTQEDVNDYWTVVNGVFIDIQDGLFDPRIKNPTNAFETVDESPLVGHIPSWVADDPEITGNGDYINWAENAPTDPMTFNPPRFCRQSFDYEGNIQENGPIEVFLLDPVSQCDPTGFLLSINDGNKLGPEQTNWIIEKVNDSVATHKIICLGIQTYGLDGTETQAKQTINLNAYFYSPTERAAFLRGIDDVENVVFLGGDLHYLHLISVAPNTETDSPKGHVNAISAPFINNPATTGGWANVGKPIQKLQGVEWVSGMEDTYKDYNGYVQLDIKPSGITIEFRNSVDGSLIKSFRKPIHRNYVYTELDAVASTHDTTEIEIGVVITGETLDPYQGNYGLFEGTGSLISGGAIEDVNIVRIADYQSAGEFVIETDSPIKLPSQYYFDFHLSSEFYDHYSPLRRLDGSKAMVDGNTLKFPLVGFGTLLPSIGWSNLLFIARRKQVSLQVISTIKIQAGYTYPTNGYSKAPPFFPAAGDIDSPDFDKLGGSTILQFRNNEVQGRFFVVVDSVIQEDIFDVLVITRDNDGDTIATLERAVSDYTDTGSVSSWSWPIQNLDGAGSVNYTGTFSKYLSETTLTTPVTLGVSNKISYLQYQPVLKRISS